MGPECPALTCHSILPMRFPIRLFWLVGLVALVFCPPAFCKTKEKETPEKELFRFEDSRVSMACTYTIAVYGRKAQQLPLIVNAAFEEVDRIDQLMSNYNPDSPLSLINKNAAKGPVPVEPELFNFLQVCVYYSRESGGAFDITVGPLMKAWGFFRGEGRIPWFFEIWSVLHKVGYQKLILDPKERTVQFGVPGMDLDLGGIAKGYAVDRVIRILKEYGITQAFVSAGGSTLYGLGAPPHTEGWEVKIRDPLAPRDPARNAGTVVLNNRCLSVAGNYEKFFQVRGTTYSHIMDPHTGYPVQNMLSVAVLTDTGVEGDAVDDILYVLGVEKSKTYLQKHAGIEVFFFLPGGPKQWRMEKLPIHFPVERTKISLVLTQDAISRQKLVPVECQLVQSAQAVGTSFGD